MEDSFRFFSNKSCKYYPCHQGIEEINCLFCYCPFYTWNRCPGKNYFKEKEDGRRIKVCTECSFCHDPQNYEKVLSILKMGEEEYTESFFASSADETVESYENDKAVADDKVCMCNDEDVCFFGIGVGPGNPKLLTVEAMEAILKSDCLILPAKDKESCRAYEIARKSMPEIEDKDCIFYPFPMTMDEASLNSFHKEVSKKVVELLKEKKNVGFLTIGDVSIYSTFIYIEKLVKEASFKTKYISGISSFSAAASRLGIPLTIGKEELHIIPSGGDIDAALKLNGTLVFMKSGKKLKELKEKLLELSRVKDIEVFSVSNCGMENEIVCKELEKIDVDSSYLTVVIVK